ncbi:MAG TPA: hypothetical protein VFE58_01330 [Tepidisphaeraceae bacterium]|jgi:hypothetical protein|nr:hypothetical protein [Tepidisphaeraceae bacterium]
MKTRISGQRAFVEGLEARRLFASSVTIKSVTSGTGTLATNQVLDVGVRMSNSSSTVAVVASAEVFLVPTGKSLDATTDLGVVVKLKPINGNGTRTGHKDQVVGKVTAGSYSLVACPIDPTTGKVDTSTTVSGPTVTYVVAPIAGSLTAGVTLPSWMKQFVPGKKVPATLSLTSQNTVASSVVPVSFYLSTNKTFGASDVAIGSTSVIAELAVDKASKLTAKLTVPTKAKLTGKYYLIAVVNPTGTNPAVLAKVVAVSATALAIANT